MEFQLSVAEFERVTRVTFSIIQRIGTATARPEDHTLCAFSIDGSNRLNLASVYCMKNEGCVLLCFPWFL